MSRRFYQHNNGYGSTGTANPIHRPYFMVAYICGISHLSKEERETYEEQWKQYVNRALNRGADNNLFVRIQQGQRVVEDYNSICAEEENRMKIIATVRSRRVDDTRDDTEHSFVLN